jgi:WD40 repeat protein
LYDADLQLAHVAWQTDNVMAAQELLQQYSKPAEVDPRGFEWHYLWGQTHEERNEWKVDDAITEFNVIFGLAISPDGKTVATAAVGATAADAKIKVWKLADGTLQKTINVGQSMVVNLSFANDGRKLTAVLFKKLDPQGNIMHARAAAARKEPFNISELSGWLETRSWTLADDQPPAITPFDPAHITGTLGLVFTGLFTQHEGIMMSVACIAGSADGKYLALAGSRGETAAAGFGKMIGGRLLVWDVEKARVRAIWETEVPLLSAAFSADGKQVAMGQGDGVVAVRRLDSMGEPKLLRGHAGIVYTLAFNASGSVLVSGALDGQVIVWDVALGKEASRKRGHAKTVMRVEIAPDQRTAVSCGVDGLVKVWDLDRPANPLVLRGHSTMISTLGFTVDSSELISVDDEQAIWWGVVDGRRLKATKSDVGVAMSMSIAPSSGKVAWCSADKVVVRDLESGKNFELTWKDNPLSHHASSQDGKVFAASNFLTEQAGSSTAGLAVWNGGGGPPVATLTALPGSIVALALSPDGSTVAYGHTGGIHLWQWKSGQSRQVLDIDGTLRMLAFSADGQWLAAGSDYSARSGGSKVRVLDLTTNRTRTECLGVGQDLSHLVFSPDGRRLATASHAAAGRGMLKLWDMVSGREVFSAPLPNAMVSAVAFSPDGHRLAAATLALDVFGIMVGRKQFPEIHVWDATPNDARRR